MSGLDSEVIGQPDARALGLLETAACLAASGYGPQASFNPLGRYLLERFGADIALLVRVLPEDDVASPLAVVPPALATDLVGQRFSCPEWLARGISAGTELTRLLGRAGDSFGQALRDGGMVCAAAARVADSMAEEPLAVVIASRRDMPQDILPGLEGAVTALEAGVRVVGRCPAPYAANPAAAAATAEQMGAVTQLAATLAHDLNNALAAILGQAELLLEELAGDPRAERVRRISGRTVQLMTLARALEEYATAQLAGQVEEADLGELARDAVEATRCVWETEARARGCTIEMSCEADEPAPVRVVVSQVKRSLVHLIFNAIQAIGDSDGQIRVRVWRDGAFAACSVSDNGVGMPPDVLRRCREPFFTTRPGVCKGLGLSFAEATARRHGGDLEIASTPGTGTTVTVYLPLRVSSAAATA